MKVLVVDDVGYSRRYHCRLLQKFGYQTESADSGPQALEILERDLTIKLVLTDLLMREMDGVELYKRSLKIDRLVDGGAGEPPAFLLMTALRPGQNHSLHKDVDRVRLAKDIGFVDVLFKPIEPDILQSTLETIKYASAKVQIDTQATLRRVNETIRLLIAEHRSDDAGQFLDELRNEVETLDQFVSQPV